MAQYPVTSQSATIFDAGYSKTTTLRNIGAKTVYLDSAITVNPSSSYPLGPGATLQWDAGQALYVVCATGDTSTLVTVQNSGNLFDPVSIGDALLTGGLAAQIAANIAVTGAPPIDVQTVLMDTVFSGNSGSFVLDTSAYQSVVISVTTTATPTGTTPRITPVCQVGWSTDGTLDPTKFVAIDTFVASDNNNQSPAYPTTAYVCGVRSAFMRFNALYAAIADVHVVVVGSYKTVNLPRYTNRSAYSPVLAGGTGLTANGTGDDGYSAIQVAASSAAGSCQWFPSTKSGEAKFVYSANNSTGVAGTLRSVVQLADDLNNILWDDVVTVPANTSFTRQQTLILPNHPLKCVMLWTNNSLNVMRHNLTYAP